MSKPEDDKAKYVYDHILGMMNGFNAPENWARFTRAEYTTSLEKKLELAAELINDLLEDVMDYRKEECAKIYNRKSDAPDIYKNHIDFLNQL